MFSVLVNGALWLSCQVVTQQQAVCLSELTGEYVTLSADELTYIQTRSRDEQWFDVTVERIEVTDTPQPSIIDQFPTIGS